MIHSNHTSKIHTDSFETNSGEEITCSVHSSFQEIADLQAEWDSFVESVNGDIYLTYDWCRLWWQYYRNGRKLHLYIFRRNQDIVGIIPMFFENIWLLFVPIRVGKIVGSDFTLTQFSLPIHPQYFDICVNHFLEALKPMHWHILNIGPLAGIYKNTEALSDALCKLSNDSLTVTIREGMVQTYFKLQPTWEEHLSYLSRGQRREIVRKYAALEKKVPNSLANMKVILADETNLNSFYTAFVDLHQDHWRKLGKLGHFGDWPAALEFHHDIAVSQLAHGRLRLMCVQLNNEVLGYEYAYKFADKYFAILNARTENEVYNEIGIGSILFAEQAKMAIREKISYIDAMRGKYEYKLRLGGELLTIKKIFVIRKGIVNSFRAYLFDMFSNLLDFMYYRVWFQRLALKLPFKRRPLWKLWIRMQ